MSISNQALTSAIAGACLFLATNTASATSAVATNAANIHAERGNGHPVVDQLSAGEAVEATRCGFVWCYVTHAGPNGWVHRRDLNIERTASGGGYAGGDDGGSGGGGGGGGNAGNAGGPGNAAAGGMIWEYLTSLFGS